MRAPTIALAALALAAGTSPSPAAAQATDWRQIKKPTLPEFKPQQPTRIVLGNGMVILLQEDHELPLVNGFARIRGGSEQEPADKVGLTSIYGQTWRTGGTRSRTGDQLDDFLEARAARVETSGGIDSTFISFDCLKGDLDDTLAVFLELLREPEFREEKITLAKTQLSTGIARRNDDPLQIAGREAAKLGYGADSPYARVAEYATVAAVTRQDLLDWHKRFTHPNNMILGVVGDFDTKVMEAKLRKLFGALPRGPAAAPAKAEFRDPKPGIYFVQKDDVTQSSIRMVHLGTTRDNPDYHALEVMNEVFGGGFSARLFSNIRSKKGLAYNVGGGVGTTYRYPGLFILSMGTKSETTAAGIDALFEEIDNLHKTPATDAELARAKESILNSFVFRYDSKAKVMNEKLALEFYGYPLDFFDRYRAAIEKVTAADVARVAQKYVHKDKLAVLVVGKALDFDKPLSSYGPVTTLDITIPEGTGKKAAPTAPGGDLTQLLARVAQGLGGPDQVKAVKALRRKGTVLAKTPQGEMNLEIESLLVFPDRLRQNVQTPMGQVTMVVSPEASFMETPMGNRDVPSSQRESLLRELKRDPFVVVQHGLAGDPKYTFTPAGSEKVGEAEAEVLDVNADGAEVRWWVDAQSGRIVRSSARTAGMGGPAQQVVDYSDFRPASGVVVPFKQKITRDGQDGGSAEMKEIEVNPAVDSKQFEKPAEAAKP
jgi:zinc protease